MRGENVVGKPLVEKEALNSKFEILINYVSQDGGALSVSGRFRPIVPDS